MGKVAIVHLSDLHVDETSDLKRRFEHLFNKIETETNNVNQIYMCVTGDITQSGKAEEFDIAKQLFTDLKTQLRNINKEVEYIFAPGNHDCDFTSQSDHFINYNQFLSYFTNYRIIKRQEEYSIYMINLFDHYIYFISINSALNIEDVHAKVVDFPEIKGILDEIESNSFVVTLFHHPEAWLYNNDVKKTNINLLNKISHLVLMGHEHNSQGYTKQEHGAVRDIEILVAHCFNHNNIDDYGFKIINVSFFENTYKINNTIIKDTGSRADDGTTQTKTFKYYFKHPLNQDFLKSIDQPSINILHKRKRDVSNRDLFTPPDLKKLSDKLSTIISVKDFCSTNLGDSLIYGSNQSGKTTLLYHILLTLYTMSYYPVFLSAKDINIKDIDLKIKAAVNDQYHRMKWADYTTITEKKKRIIIIDDFDKLIVSDYTDKFSCISKLKNSFSHILLSTNLVSFSSYLLNDIIQYQIQPLTCSKSLELITKWVKLGYDNETDTSILDASIDDLNRKMETMFENRIVERYPFFLISSLMILDNMVPQDQLTQYSDYFHYIISIALEHALKRIDSRKNTPTKVHNYILFLKPLAFHMYEKKQKYLTIDQYNEFLAILKEKYIPIETDPSVILKVFVTSGILISYENKISFAMEYNYHLSLGKYLAENCSKPNIAEIVDELINTIHLSDSSNVLLFLAHHVNPPHDSELWKKLQIQMCNYLKECGQETLEASRLTYMSKLENLLPIDLSNICKKNLIEQQKDKDESLTLIDRILDNKEDLNGFESFDTNIIKILQLTFVTSHIIKHRYSTTEINDLKNLIIETTKANLRLLKQFIDVSEEIAKPFRYHIVSMLKFNISNNMDCSSIETKSSELLTLLMYFGLRALSGYPAIVLCSNELLEIYLQTIPDDEPVYQMMKIIALFRYSEGKIDEVYIEQVIKQNKNNYWLVRMITEEYAHYQRYINNDKLVKVDTLLQDLNVSKIGKTQNLRDMGIIGKRG